MPAIVGANCKFNVLYQDNGSNVSNMPADQSSSWILADTEQKSIRLRPTVPLRTYYTFGGWAYTSGGAAAKQPSDYVYHVFNGLEDETYNLNLYAVWNHNTAYVYYNANGGSGAPSTQSHWAGYSVTLRSEEPTRSGYTFLGWATSASATSATYLPGTSCPLYSTTTLYAVWKIASSDVSAGNGTLGSALSISITRYNSAYKHKLEYKYGNETGTIAKAVDTSYSWTPPLSLASQFPSATGGTCTITCKTFSGSTLIGTKTVDVTLSIPNTIKVGISSVALAETVSGITAKFSAFVQGKSKIKVTGTFDTSNAYGATVASVSIAINGQTLTANAATTNVISGYGTLSYTMTITDTRGRTVTYTGTYTVLQYSAPTVSEKAQRVSGTPSSIAVKYTFAISPCSNLNDKTLKIYTKPAASPDYSYTLVATIALSAYSGSDITYTITNTDTNTTYTVKVELIDYFTTVTATKTVAATGNRIVDISPTTKTISLHESNPDDGKDHEYKRIVFHDGIMLGDTLLTEAQLIALLNLLS